MHLIIVEDLPFDQEKLADLIRQDCASHGESVDLSFYASGEDFLAHYRPKSCDGLFLDVLLGGLTGIEVARRVREAEKRLPVIFTTRERDYAVDGFAVDATDYLVKPLDEKRFRQTMDRVLGELSKEARTRLILRQKGMYAVVPLSDLVYCEVQGRKLYLHRTDGTVLDFYGRLDEFTKRVDTRFFRCHRSYLVNLDHIRGCSPGRVYLIPNGEIPVSRLREQALKQALLCHMKRPAGTQTPPIPAD